MRKLSTIFPDFDESLIEHLQKVGEVTHVSAGDLLLRPGQYFKSTMVVLDGLVKLYMESEKGEEMFLYFLETGNACALSIAGTTSRNINVKAKAITNVTLLTIPVEQMDVLIRTYPRWLYFLLDTYNTRFRELFQALYQTAFLSMDERLLEYLRRQFTALQTNTISITHQEIASDLNSSREVISRLLKKLESDDLVSISRNEITNLAL